MKIEWCWQSPHMSYLSASTKPHTSKDFYTSMAKIQLHLFNLIKIKMEWILYNCFFFHYKRKIIPFFAKKKKSKKGKKKPSYLDLNLVPRIDILCVKELKKGKREEIEFVSIYVIYFFLLVYSKNILYFLI